MLILLLPLLKELLGADAAQRSVRPEGYELKVIVTNKSVRAKHVVAFHEGRGAQEGGLLS